VIYKDIYIEHVVFTITLIYIENAKKLFLFVRRSQQCNHIYP